MDFVNHTKFPASVFRMAFGEDKVAASLLTRVTYGLDGTKFIPSAEQPWIVSSAPWRGPQGPMDSDLVFIKGGVDLFVFGHAYALRGKPTPQMDVEVAVDDWKSTVKVFGERVWWKPMGTLVPTNPIPFTIMPLQPAYAFGGKDTWDEREIAWPDNPEGKGFYLEAASAVDRPLPNLENPDERIQRWDDRPEPAGTTPIAITTSMRMKRGASFDERGQVTELRPVLYNAAYPRLVAPRLKPGQTVRLTGVHPSGPLSFQLPDARLFARVRFGDDVREVPLAIDQIGFELEAKRAFIAYRYPFRYTIHALQRRACELFERP
ncbi:DUF2169 family type VI secretion system accessory protein [Chondromyces crocatus]|uniref:DUF2169 domain-containing protein n=1 Tax=Chondromyces crocatus TaxID=52 RepID=A0A0K1EPZ0_CHOCO|nr:DUF2169 domain-containing protein [Chondromyces crocatus]AKT42712.1 uncharacterized protein CMC5_069390 [Chondromyces crocatus]